MYAGFYCIGGCFQSALTYTWLAPRGKLNEAIALEISNVPTSGVVVTILSDPSCCTTEGNSCARQDVARFDCNCNR